MNTDRFTVVFAGDLRALPFNPMTAETAFGKVQACAVGDRLIDIETLVAALKIGREAARWRAKGTHDCDCDRCKQHRADVAAIDAALKLAGETP
jgi:hypothetical protein